MGPEIHKFKIVAYVTSDRSDPENVINAMLSPTDKIKYRNHSTNESYPMKIVEAEEVK